MKKLLGALFAVLFFASLSNAAPVVTLDDAVIDLTTDSSVILSLYLNGSDSDPISSATFTVEEIEGLSWAVSYSQPDGWVPTTVGSKFGATDFSWPGTAVKGQYKFADITLSWDNSVDSTFLSLMETTGQYTFGFSFVELSDELASAYADVKVEGGVLSTVPIPSSLFLLGGGVCTLIGLIRRESIV